MSILSSKLRQDSVALDELARGWLPVDAVVVDGRPGLWWMDMSGVSLTEPFFQQTVERTKAENSQRGEQFTEFDVLMQLEKTLDSVPPTGFIFHSSRCGSTLVANACRAITNSIVLSEANAIDKLVARFITDAPEGTVKESIYSVFLRSVVHTLGQRRTGSEQHLFVKFSCCSFAQIARITRIWPRVPWVFLYRDPVETIVSNLSIVPPWLLDDDRRVLASITGAPPVEVAKMGLEEMCARAIGSLFSIAYRVADANSMLINYNQLSVPVISSVLRFFNVSLSADEMSAIERGSLVYSKEVSSTRTFVDDSAAKRELASDLIREMAERWAMEPYRLLEQKRLRPGSGEKMMTSSNLTPGKHVVVTDFDGGEGILVDLNTKKYYQLNETAMVVWKGLEQGKTTGEIAADITSSYEVTLDKATLSVQRIVDNFQTYKLVSAK